MKKKLIEVALPLDAINAASAREKSIRHGHPSTLHLWWARRPLATARAVIWSSLVDDPSAHPEEFPTEEDQDRERQRLFGILERLVIWENSNNEEVLAEAKAEIERSCGKDLPPLLDPFAGGGSIPLEAQRLGLEAIAHDLNPVAVLINKAEIEIPPKFAGMPPVNPEARRKRIQSEWPGSTGLAADVEYYGNMLRDLAFEKICHLYPKVVVPAEQGGGEATVIAWLWTRTVKCPNPACGHEAPLVRSFDLSKRKGKEWHVEPITHDGELDFEVKPGLSDRKGTIDRRGAICAHCGEPIGLPYIRSEAQAGRMGERLMAIVAEGKRGRAFISPNDEQSQIAIISRPAGVPDAKLPHNPRDFKTHNYGMDSFADLFTNRQLTLLTTFSSLLDEIRQIAEDDARAAGLKDDGKGLDCDSTGAKAYAEAISVYLAFVIDKLADYHSAVCSWNSPGEKLRGTFGRQAIPMVWDYAEGNPFCSSSGSFKNMMEWVYKVLLGLPYHAVEGHAIQVAAQTHESSCRFIVSTDPPYYDNIGYADLSDYFYIWLRLSLHEILPELFRTLLVPKSDELVATPYRFEGNANEAQRFFETGMASALMRIDNETVDELPITIYYAYKQEDTSSTGTASTGWETMLAAIMRAGLEIVATWPMRSEKPGRMLANGTNALASSIVIVCRRRAGDERITTRRDFVRELRRTMGPALRTLQNSHIAPVDFAQAAIGPGMEVFSRYSQVLEANGQTMGVRAALELINDELDRHLSDQSDDFGRETRLCVDLYNQSGWGDLEYGDADVLARAKNGSIQALVGEGSAASGRGLVHLVRREDLPKSLPSISSEWLKAQFLVRELDTGGVDACAKALASFSVVDAERARNLAYRLFNIADAHGWTKDANAYNGLVVSWQDIALRAEEYRSSGGEQLSFGIDGE